MSILISKNRILSLFLSLCILTALGSCAASNTRNHSWTDLNHARELDKKKGKRLKKIQKSYAKQYHY